VLVFHLFVHKPGDLTLRNWRNVVNTASKIHEDFQEPSFECY